MSATLLVASALFSQAAFAPALESRDTTTVDVAYEELSSGRSAAAVEKLEVKAEGSDDPATLINLGTAYARVGMTEKAITAYRAAVASEERYDLQLADGTWMDSRRAARSALQELLRVNAQAAR